MLKYISENSYGKSGAMKCTQSSRIAKTQLWSPWGLRERDEELEFAPPFVGHMCQMRRPERKIPKQWPTLRLPEAAIGVTKRDQYLQN